MASKIPKEEYKNYAPPISLFLGYLISGFGGCFLIDYLAIILFNTDLTGMGMTILSDMISFVLMIVATIVWLIIFIFPSVILGYRDRKIYRGKGFYTFINFVTFGVILFFIANIVFLQLGGIGVVFACVGMVIARFTIYTKIIKKCSGCGLVNTFRLEDLTETHLGTRYEFYNYGTEGYAYAKKRSLETFRCSVCNSCHSESYEYEKQL